MPTTNDKVDAYIEALADDAKQLAVQIRQMIHQTLPDAREEFKWSRPCYEANEPICYFVVNKKHINLGFYNGIDLEDPHGLLEGTGKKLRHVKIQLQDGVIPDGAEELLQSAGAAAASA